LKGKKINEIFEDAEDFIYYNAPGRINIIGEHTDYNHGFVLPATIDRSIRLAIRKNNLGILRAYSREFPGLKLSRYPIKSISKNDGWVKYLKAILLILQEEIGFQKYSGLDVYITSDIPIGAGLSSSAALEVAFLFALDDMYNLQIKPIHMAAIAQKAENDYVGVQCGIMDQFVSIMGKENHAIFLDIQKMNYQYIPLYLNDFVFILIDTTISHDLDNSEYNTRRLECETGLKIIQACSNSKLKSLREVQLKDVQRCRDKLPVNIYKRLVYVIEENLRVKRMVKALRKQSFNQVGQLLYASHNGLKYLFEVSCPELDLIVDYLGASNGVIGARMMGGGFGGCVLALIKKDSVKKVFPFIKEKYDIIFKKYPRLFPITITPGLAVKK
jgi:galactokinase